MRLSSGPRGKEATTSVRSEEELVLQVLAYWNGSYLHPDAILAEVKKIDRRYGRRPVMQALARLASSRTIDMVVEYRVKKYGVHNPRKPLRMFGVDYEKPMAVQPIHEDIVPMEPWDREEG